MQQLELLIPYVVAALTMWGTPGPNNMMLAYSGARFGLRPTLPHIAGVVVGNTILNVVGILGLKPIVERWPETLFVLQIAGSIWLCWVGFKMARSAGSARPGETEDPMSFSAAILFQFSNPKAIAAASTLASLVFVATKNNAWLWLPALFLIPPLGLIANGPWALAGMSVRGFLATPLRWRVFAITTGTLTAGCAIFLWT